MKKPDYSEPMIGWNEDDFHAGVAKFGVAHCEGTAKLKIATPTRPVLLPPCSRPHIAPTPAAPPSTDAGGPALIRRRAARRRGREQGGRSSTDKKVALWSVWRLLGIGGPD